MADVPAVDLNDAAPRLVLTVRVRGVRRYRAKLWVASLLIRLACRLMRWEVFFEEAA